MHQILAHMGEVFFSQRLASIIFGVWNHKIKREKTVNCVEGGVTKLKKKEVFEFKIRDRNRQKHYIALSKVSSASSSWARTKLQMVFALLFFEEWYVLSALMVERECGGPTTQVCFAESVHLQRTSMAPCFFLTHTISQSLTHKHAGTRSLCLALIWVGCQCPEIRLRFLFYPKVIEICWD